MGNFPGIICKYKITMQITVMLNKDMMTICFQLLLEPLNSHCQGTIPPHKMMKISEPLSSKLCGQRAKQYKTVEKKI